MNLRTLRKQFGSDYKVTRSQARDQRVIEVRAGGVHYSMTEKAFANEAELVEHAKSKIPILTVRPA